MCAVCLNKNPVGFQLEKKEKKGTNRNKNQMTIRERDYII
jgi:hypothetical protein